MALKLLKDNLPWIAISAAIVLQATGFFDRFRSGPDDIAETTYSDFEPSYSSRSEASLEQETFSQTLPDRQVVALTAPEPRIVTAPGATALDVSRSTDGTLSLQNGLTAAALTPDLATPLAKAEPTAPLPSATQDAAAFFNAAQANLALANSCVEDLKALAQRASVYFPSGGLTAEDAGLAQARLIGQVAQNCPGVTIQVEGHSDPSGDPRVNLQLSQDRAEAVIARIAASGVDTSKFVAKGFGDARPSQKSGPLPSAYYDRRVEFSVVTRALTAAQLPVNRNWQQVSACATQLQRDVAQAKIVYAPGSITVSQQDIDAALRLASQAAACPDARLRVIGQHSDAFGSRESIITGRLRALALMNTLVDAGIDAGQIIVAAPSWSIKLPGQPNLSDSRIDFDVILEDS